eukprot:144860-Chlamydomonas_euryale.AAC.10
MSDWAVTIDSTMPLRFLGALMSFSSTPTKERETAGRGSEIFDPDNYAARDVRERGYHAPKNAIAPCRVAVTICARGA